MALFPTITPEQVAQVTPLVIDALVANYAGDESPSATTIAILNGLVASPQPAHTLGLMLWGLWTDLWPPDNDLTIPFSQFSAARMAADLPSPLARGSIRLGVEGSSHATRISRCSREICAERYSKLSNGLK